MAGFDTYGQGEFSVSEILGEVKGSSTELNTTAQEFSLEDILAEFGTASGAKPAQKSVTAESEQQSVVPVKKQEKPVQKSVKTPQKKSKEAQKERETLPKSERKPAKIPKEKKQKQEKTPAKPKQKRPKKQKNGTAETYTFEEFFKQAQDEKQKKTKEKQPQKQKTAVKKSLGPSVSPQEYVNMKKSAAHLRGVCAILLLLSALALFYVCFAARLGIPIPTEITFDGGVELHHVIVLALSAFAIFAAFPIMLEGIRQCLRRRPSVEATLFFAQVANILQLLVNLCFQNGQLQQPYAPVSVFALFFAVCGLWKRDRARIRACKTASLSKEPLGIYVNERERSNHIIKQPVKDVNCFARNVENTDGATYFWRFAAPLAMASTLIFSIVAGIVSRDLHRFFWTLAAVSSAITPFFALYAFAQPYAILCRALSLIGSAITGWYAAETLAGEKSLIIRDSDLFPKGAVAIHGIKMLGDFSLEQSLSYVTSVFKESNNGLFSVFYAELKSKFGRLVQVRNMRHYEGGGLEAELEGNQILVGTGAFMTRMGVRLGDEKDAKSMVFIAINGSAAALFHIKYKGNAEVREVLLDAIDQKVKPILAVVDFNLTPMMVERIFDLPEDSLEYPNIEERLDLATDNRFLDQDACAFVTRSGFVPFASSLLAAQRLRKVTMKNIWLTAACMFVGMMLMFALTWIGNTYASAPYHLFWYQLLWMLPMLIISQRVK